MFLFVAVNDVASAAMATLGGVLTLYRRGRTGEGQRVWTSLAGQAALMQSSPAAHATPADLLGELPDDDAIDRMLDAGAAVTGDPYAV